jgi:hypothetical protein
MQKRRITICLAISLLISSYGCNQQKELVVQPISEEFNDEYLTGKGLDTNYFSTSDVMQYYQVSDYGSLTAEQTLARLHDFTMARFPLAKLAHIHKLTLLFYKKKMFVDYSDHLYESARENDTRRLVGYEDELLASISFERVKADSKKISFKQILYNRSRLQLKSIDTISVQ